MTIIACELVAAYAGKFVHLPSDALNYAYQFDSTRYAKFLRARAEADGVVRREGKIATVEKNGEGDRIVSLSLENSDRIEGDLFLDCTGFRALLAGEALGAEFEDWNSLAALRPRDRGADESCAAADTLYEGHGARRRLAVADSAPASRRQRHRLLQQVSQRRDGARTAAWQY